jgi:predicted nucleic acid-binding protein
MARKVADRLGVHVIGTVGLLLLAKHRGLIQQIRPFLAKLQEAGFRIHPDLVRLAMEQAGE